MTDLAGNSATFIFNNSGAGADLNAPYTDSGAAAVLTLDEANSAGVVTEAAGAVSDGAGAISLDLEGVGQFVFQGADSYSGTTTIFGGTVSVEANGALGSGSIFFNNGSSLGALQSLASNFSTSQTIAILANAAPTLEAAAGDMLTSTGYFDIEGATLHIGSATDPGTVALGANGNEVGGKNGLSVDGGTLKVLGGFSNVLSQLTGGVTVNGALDVDGNNVTLENLTGAGAIENSSGTAVTVTFDATNTPAFSGSISGNNLSLDLASGEQDLTGQTSVAQATIASSAHLKIGANTNATFSGNVVDNGRLEFNTSNSLAYAQQLSGSGSLLINSAKAITLSGDDSGYDGDVDISSQSTLSLAHANEFGALNQLEVGGVLEAMADESFTTALEFGGLAATLEATAGHTLSLTGALTDLGGGDSLVGTQVHIGSATDTGTVVLGDDNGGPGFDLPGASIEIDGGTLNVQSDLSLSGVPVSFKGMTGVLVLNSTASAVSVSSGAGATGTVDLNSAQVNFTGGGETVNFSSDSGNVASLSSTSNWDLVNGSNGTINLTSSQASVVGGGDTIGFSGSNNYASLYSTGGNWDLVNGANGVVIENGVQVSAIGGGDTIDYNGSSNVVSLYSTAANWDLVNGSNGTVIENGVQVSVIGGSDTIDDNGSGNVVSLYSTAGNWDLVNGSNGTIIENGIQASVIGGGDTIDFNGSGDAASLYSTAGDWDLVNGSNGTIIENGIQASVIGGGDTIDFNGSGDAASLYSTAGDWDLVNGSNDTIIVNNAQTSVIGGGDTIDFNGLGGAASLYTNGGVSDTVNGSAATVILTNSITSVTGASDTISFAGNDTATANGDGDLFAFGAALGQSAINGFNASDSMQLSKSDFASFQALQQHMSQSGANTWITLDASDQITLTNVTASSLTASQFKFV